MEEEEGLFLPAAGCPAPLEKPSAGWPLPALRLPANPGGMGCLNADKGGLQVAWELICTLGEI